MTDLLKRIVDRQDQEPVIQPGGFEGGVDRCLERFQKFFPPKFLGGPDPEIVKSWLERLIDIFAALNYTEERQVTFAVFQFERAARSWWNVVRIKWERNQTPWTWANLVREFNEKYFPPLIQEKREDDFVRLQQGNLSVAEYETQFTRLSKFALELVMTERKRVRRFVQGLNVEIQEALAVVQIDTFVEALEKSQRVESARFQVKTFQTRKKCADWHIRVNQQEHAAS
ncbi:uncharacterized protein LOC113769273 [Coffea eugenioides]|uniref:uncharacterized protein LOC113769273 n=1 Tax=Coffea eugenioides TaxID=49369 RepID=UPI000F5CC72A|nr:uncharacterized protein LOC113740987 [Coffea arabica]XP_027169537.1 uncharacterized protein LOC113769273 [Coffea eugenioides]